jgi:hypothetical protein
MANAGVLYAELSPLIHGIFEDHMFIPLEEKSEFDKYRAPFPARYAAELRRRVDVVHLDTLKERPSLQQRKMGAVKTRSDDDVCFVYPFIQPRARWRLSSGSCCS